MISKTELENGFFVKTGPGAKLVSEFEKFKKMTVLPKFMIETIKTGTPKEMQENQQIPVIFKAHFEEEMQNIKLSFFKLIIFLRKMKREFALIFHSNKSCVSIFCEEMNAFFSGEHPLHNGKNGTQMMKMDNGKGGKTFMLGEENKGKFIIEKKEEGFGVLRVTDFLETSKSAEKEISSFEEIYVQIDENLRKVFLKEWLFYVAT